MSRIHSLLYTLCLLLLFGIQVQSQVAGKKQELLYAIKDEKSTSAKPELFRELAILLQQENNFDSAVIIYHSGLANSTRIKNLYWEARYGLWLGGVYTLLTSFDSAKKYFSYCDPLLLKLKNDTLNAQFYQNKGTLFQFLNDMDSAAVYTLQAIAILEKMGTQRPPNLLGPAYANLSGILNAQGLFSKALEYDRKAIAHKSDFRSPADYASIYYNAAVTYEKTGQKDKFRIYLDSAAYFNQRYPSNRNLLNIYTGYGKFHEISGHTDSAISYYRKAMELSKTESDMYFFSETAINLSSLLFKSGKTKEAGLLLEEALKNALSFGDKMMLSEIYRGKKDIAASEGRFKDAFTYAELFKTYADSVTNETTNRTTLSLEARYENQKREKENSDLKLTITQNELTITKRNRTLLAGGLLAASLVIVLLLLNRTNRQKRMLAEKDKTIQQDHIRFLERQQQVVSLQSMINGQETERTRIARDLHDGLSGMFSTVRMYCSSLVHEKKELKENPVFRKTVEMIDQAAEEIRRIAHNMMPEVLMKLGLVHALQDLCANISAGKLLQVRLQAYGMEQRMNPSTEIMLYRILQELLNNIIKHARATEAIIQFNRDGNRLMVTVEDNGRGFDQLKEDGALHAGLDTVKSRVDYLNGQITIDSQMEMGTTITMEFLIHEEV